MLTSYLISVNPIQSEFPIIQQFSYETGDSGNMPCIRILCKKKSEQTNKEEITIQCVGALQGRPTFRQHYRSHFSRPSTGSEVPPFAAHGSLTKPKQDTHAHTLTHSACTHKNVAITVIPNTTRDKHTNVPKSSPDKRTKSSVRSARSKVIKCTKYFAQDLSGHVSYIPCTKCSFIKKGLR